MGQLVSSADLKRFTESLVQASVEQATGRYSRLFNQSPTFVTFYSQDLAGGGSDVNLGGAIDVVGPESAIRYKSVADFPLYGIGAVDLTTAYDETQGSITGNVQGECHVLPGTVEPYENDLFVIDYLTVKLTFRIRQVDADRLEGKSFYKVQWFLDQSDIIDVVDGQLTERYQFEIANIGTNVSPIVEVGLSLLLSQLRVIEDRLKSSYWGAFYDRSSGTAILRDSPMAWIIHDNALDLFISRNDLLSSDCYLGSRVVVPADYRDRGLFLDTVYPTTIYSASENAVPWSSVGAGITNLVDLMRSRPLTAESAFFELAACDGMTEAVPVAGNDGLPNYYIGGLDFIAGIGAAGPRSFDGGGNYSAVPIQALAQRCLNECFRPTDGEDPKGKAASLLAGMNDASLLVGRPDFFWLGPIVLMEAKILRQYATTCYAASAPPCDPSQTPPP